MAVVFTLGSCSDRTPLDEVLSTLKTVGFRTCEGRISGAPHAPFSTAAMPPKSRGVIGLVLRDHAKGDDHAYALAALLAGNNGDAATALQRARASHPRDARIWNDIAVVHIRTATTANDAHELAEALAATDEALQLSPRLLEALFNRAIVLEKLNLADFAAIAYSAYLREDDRSQWATEARVRLARLRQTPDTQLWDLARAELASCDDARLGQIVVRFRQESRSNAETEFLADWGTALRANDSSHAEKALSLAERIGTVLKTTNGDCLLHDAVAAARRSEGTALASAHIMYRTARRMYSSRDVAGALPLFVQAAPIFERYDSPMAFVSRYYIANCLYDRNLTAESEKSIDDLLRQVPDQYRSLRALLLWQKGTAAARQRRLHLSLQSYRSALALFEELDERTFITYMRAAVELTSATLGMTTESWRMRIDTFGFLSRSGHARPLQAELESAARTEMIASHWRAARSLYSLAIGLNFRQTNPRVHVNCLVWRAFSAHRAGEDASADEDLERARIALAAIPDPILREDSANLVRFALGSLKEQSAPREAIKALTEMIDYAETRHDLFYLPEAHLERARAFRVIGNAQAARDDLMKTLALVAERRDVSDDLRDSFFFTADTAAHELVDLVQPNGDFETLFRAAERARGREFANSQSQGLTLAGVISRLPPRTVIAHFTALRDRLVILVINSGGAAQRIVWVNASDLTRWNAELRQRIIDGDDATDIEAQLYRFLLDPFESQLAHADTLVIVPDSVIAAVPFAALRRGKNSPPLIDRFTIVHAPNADDYVTALSENVLAPVSALVVGNPDTSAVDPTLPRLHAAEIEAHSVSALYPRAIQLTGASATPEAVESHMQQSVVIHLGAHFVCDRVDPNRSFLVLTGDARHSGALYVGDIVKLSIHQTRVAFLAGCRTAAGNAQTYDTRTLATAFHAAGAGSSIGTLWNVDDGLTTRLSVAFHRRLLGGMSAAHAMREAMRQMLHSSNHSLRMERTWSGFQIIGSGL